MHNLKKLYKIDPAQGLDAEYTVYINNISIIEHNYFALRRSIAQQLQSKKYDKSLQDKLNDAIYLSNELIICLGSYLQLPDRHKRYSQDLVMYKQWDTALKTPQDGDDNPTNSQPDEESSLSSWTWAAGIWLGWNQSLNLMRLLIGRVRNIFRFLCLIMIEASNYSDWFVAIDTYIAPVISQLSWVFFLPRLIIEFSNKGYHVLFPRGVHEKSLSMSTRLLVHVKENWWDLAVWMSWCLCGLVVCFVLVGNPIASGFLLFSVQASEVFINIARAAIEYQRFCDLKTKYELLKVNEPDLTSEIDKHLQYLDMRSADKYHELLCNISINMFFLLAVGLMLTASAIFCPILPIIGAALSVLGTLAWIYYVKCYLPGLQAETFLQVIPTPEPGVIYIKKPDIVETNIFETNIFEHSIIRNCSTPTSVVALNISNNDLSGSLWYR